jgi:hypothetical protein
MIYLLHPALAFVSPALSHLISKSLHFSIVSYIIPSFNTPMSHSEKMVNEKVEVASSHGHADKVEAVETVHTDGTVDLVDTHAIGGELNEMPSGYFRSVNFIGTVIAVCMGSICAYLGWVLPANTL